MSKTKSCKTCNECKRVYRKTGLRYWRGKRYYCAAKKILLKNFDGCEKWKKTKIEYDLSKERFDSIEKDIKEIIHKLPNTY